MYVFDISHIISDPDPHSKLPDPERWSCAYHTGILSFLHVPYRTYSTQYRTGTAPTVKKSSIFSHLRELLFFQKSLEN